MPVDTNGTKAEALREHHRELQARWRAAVELGRSPSIVLDLAERAGETWYVICQIEHAEYFGLDGLED